MNYTLHKKKWSTPNVYSCVWQVYIKNIAACRDEILRGAHNCHWVFHLFTSEGSGETCAAFHGGTDLALLLQASSCKNIEGIEMKNRVLFVICLMGLLVPSLPSRADIDHPQIDELAETKLDQELEAEDSQQIAVDQQYAKEQGATSDKELKEAQAQTNALKNKNEKASAEIQDKLSQIENEKRTAEQAQASIEKLQIELVNNRKEIDRLREEVNAVKQQRSLMKQKQVKAKSELAQAEREKKSLAKEEIRLSRDVKVAAQQYKNLRARHSKLVAQNRSLKARNHKKQVALRITKTKLAKNSQD